MSRSATDFTLPSRAVAVRLVAGRGHYATVIEAVARAETSVWIATANLKDLWVEAPRRAGQRRRGYRSILELFDELAARRVELRILHAALPSRAFRASFDAHRRLTAGGLELRLCPRVHLKLVIIDGSELYLGSANWTGAGLGAKGEGRRNFELGIVTDDAPLLDEVQALYDRIWRGLECPRCRLRGGSRGAARCEAPLDAG
jgi:phosphatidylserine/phosphatidylglycerophosphate/cardiolipin synthase-like enzyme